MGGDDMLVGTRMTLAAAAARWLSGSLGDDIGECSVGLSCAFHPETCWENCKCSACKKIVGPLEGTISAEGCIAADLEVAGPCETFFLGPADPASELCIAAWAIACPIIAL